MVDCRSKMNLAATRRRRGVQKRTTVAEIRIWRRRGAGSRSPEDVESVARGRRPRTPEPNDNPEGAKPVLGRQLYVLDNFWQRGARREPPSRARGLGFGHERRSHSEGRWPALGNGPHPDNCHSSTLLITSEDGRTASYSRVEEEARARRSRSLADGQKPRELKSGDGLIVFARFRRRGSGGDPRVGLAEAAPRRRRGRF